MGIKKPRWKVEIWAEDEDFRLPKDDRARECVRVVQVHAANAAEARDQVLENVEIRRRWPKANAVAFPV